MMSNCLQFAELRQGTTSVCDKWTIPIPAFAAAEFKNN
jgi:hypothetical protein